jgi:hypothetical protein
MFIYKFIDKTDAVIKAQLFLNPPYVDKNRLAAFHSYDDKENCFMRLWLTLIHFLSLPTNSCCLSTVANWQPICHNIFDATPKTNCHHCESKLISRLVKKKVKCCKYAPRLYLQILDQAENA